MKDIITKLLAHKNTPRESDKLIEEFIKKLMLKEGKIINLETPRDKIVPRTSSRKMKCTIGTVGNIEDETDSMDEQFLTMMCFEEINYYHNSDIVKDI